MNKKKMNIVVIAGAAGIGKEIAVQYATAGHRVFVGDINENSILDVNSVEEGIEASLIDVASYTSVKSFFRQIDRNVKCLDVLINCAGIAGPTSLLEDIEPGEWEKTIQVNLNGMFYCCKHAIPMLSNSKAASIINIASTAAQFGFPMRSPYSASKWAVIGLTKTLAMELGPRKIRVNAICPGSVSGERIDKVIQTMAKKQNNSIEEIQDLFTRHVSMKTFVEAKDIASICQYLSSDAGRFISGQSIGVDGHTEGLFNDI